MTEPKYKTVSEASQNFATCELWKWANYESPFWKEMREDCKLNDLPLPWPEFNRLAARRFKRPKKVKFILGPELLVMDDYCEGDQRLTKTGDGTEFDAWYDRMMKGDSND